EKTDEGGICSVGIAAEILKQEDSIVRQYVIRQMIGETYQSLKDITSVHVEAAEKLLFKPVGRRIQLPDGGCALRTY
ncbi:MAG: tRNA(Ile)-lysidine synthetase, partial [Hungatella hathewayi]|nr:tRNA(Ile)-lysidine synthetase [Hungatella hathewayi]